MIKLTSLMLLLAAFFMILSLYIAPQQGAFIPSTTINESSISQAKPEYKEHLPIQEFDLRRQGRSIIFAVAFLSHIQFANLQLGGAWVILVTEFLFLRSKRARYRRLARSMTFFNIILFSVGSTMGSAAALYVISLYPVFSANIFHIYWWPILVNILLYGTQIFFLWLYFYNWKSMNAFFHQLVGAGYALSVFFQSLAISTMDSGMLTPGSKAIAWGETGLLTMDPRTVLSWWFNPTLWNLQWHRLAASVAFFGFIIAVLSMLHFQDRKDPPAQKFWDWAGSYGMAWGLLGLAAQPALGFLYMTQIMNVSPGAFKMIMQGPRAWEFLWMVALLSALVLTSLVYFIDRRETVVNQRETRNIEIILKALLLVAAASAFILVNPSWLGAAFMDDPSAWINPLGDMNYKYIALAGLVVVSALVVMIDVFILGDVRDQDWGNLPKSSRLSGIFAGVLGMWVVMTMGFIRESARAPWTIWKIVPVPGGTAYPTPISLWGMFMIWIALLAFSVGVFWYVSKVTAENPPRSGAGRDVDLKGAPREK